MRSSDFLNHSYNYRPNWTALSPNSITTNNNNNNNNNNNSNDNNNNNDDDDDDDDNSFNKKIARTARKRF